MNEPSFNPTRSSGTLFRILLGVALLVAFGFAYVRFFNPKLMQWSKWAEKREDFRQKNERLNEQIADLKQRQLLIGNDVTYDIIIAHSDNKVLPDELVFVFPRPRK